MSKNIRKLVGVLCALLLLAQADARAQDGLDSTMPSRPLTRQGSSAFIFSLGGLDPFNISAPEINGLVSSVGVKYYIADEMAIRLLLGFNSDQTADASDSTKTLTNSAFGISAGVEKHFGPLYAISPFVGGQVSFTSESFEHQQLASSTEKGNEGASISTMSTKQSVFGIGALIGADWYLLRAIAIGAEMGLQFRTRSGTKENGASEPSTTWLGLYTAGGDVHFIVHF